MTRTLTTSSVTGVSSTAELPTRISIATKSITGVKSSAHITSRKYKNQPLKQAHSTPLFIYDRNEKMRLILSDTTTPYREGWFTEELNGQVSLSFEVRSNSPDVHFIENEGRVVLQDMDGDFREFIIREVSDYYEAGSAYKTVYAEGSEYELIDEWLTGYIQPSTNIRTALSAILGGTRWSVGNVEVPYDVQPVELRHMSVRLAVNELLDLFGYEVKYRIETAGNRVIGRYIDIYTVRGSDTGKLFHSGRDIVQANRTYDSHEIKTALYGIGAADEYGKRLDFTGVEWVKADGFPVDKPLGQAWVGDVRAMEQWGAMGGRKHRFGGYEGQEEDPAELLLNTWRELQRMNKLRDTYELDVIQLEELLGYDHDKIRLGDRVRAVVDDINPPLETEASIVEYRQNLNDRKLSECTVGHFRAVMNTNQRLNNLEDDYGNKRGEWDKKPNEEDVEDIANNYAQQAIDEAQERLDQAREELDQAIEELENGMITLDDAMVVADNVFDNKINKPQNYVGHFEGDVGITGQLDVMGEIYAGSDATIRGNLNANNLNLRNANILNANIQNANITGTLNGVDGRFVGQLDGVDGTFTGDIIGARIYSADTTFVGSELTVSDRIYLGNQQAGNRRQGLYFTSRTYLQHETDGSLSLNTSGGSLSLYASQAYEFYLQNGDNGPRILSEKRGSNSQKRLKLSSRGNNGAGLWLDHGGNAYFVNNQTVTHTFYAAGIKDGGSIDIDGNRYGMSPIDSPQTLIYDLITDVQVDGETVVYLDDLYAKTIDGYAVFVSNPNVTVIDKQDDSFTVTGDGLCDFQVVGNRVGYKGTYFTDMTSMTEELTR